MKTGQEMPVTSVLIWSIPISWTAIMTASEMNATTVVYQKNGTFGRCIQSFPADSGPLVPGDERVRSYLCPDGYYCNKDQADQDNDGIGDACDNCPGRPNGLQIGWCIRDEGYDDYECHGLHVRRTMRGRYALQFEPDRWKKKKATDFFFTFPWSSSKNKSVPFFPSLFSFGSEISSENMWE